MAEMMCESIFSRNLNIRLYSELQVVPNNIVSRSCPFLAGVVNTVLGVGKLLFRNSHFQCRASVTEDPDQ